jgi:hypothetical protein
LDINGRIPMPNLKLRTSSGISVCIWIEADSPTKQATAAVGEPE